MYHKYKHMMDKEEVGSSSKGTTDMENIAGITSKGRTVHLSNGESTSVSYDISNGKLKLPTEVLKDKLLFNGQKANIGNLRTIIKQRFCVNQRKYALELIAEVGLRNAKPSLTPLECNIKLTNVDSDQDIKTTYIFPDSLIIGNPKSGILSLGVLQRLSTGLLRAFDNIMSLLKFPLTSQRL
uniref:Uncharacterized protein n=1 Tax=Solanum lycopersicum TaxID=4081 RepID=A0A3Q7IG51_SOLLC